MGSASPGKILLSQLPPNFMLEIFSIHLSTLCQSEVLRYPKFHNWVSGPYEFSSLTYLANLCSFFGFCP